MAAILPQDQAVNAANTIFALMASLNTTQAQIDSVIAQYNTLTLGNYLQNLPTCVLAADGSLGAADGAASPAHPIDTRVTTAVNRPISANDIASMVTALQGVSDVIQGQSLAANGAIPQLVAKCL